MSNQLDDIMQKRALLLARIAGHRELIAAAATRLKMPLAVADQGFAVGRYLRSNPLSLAGLAGIVTLVAIKRRGMIAVAAGALRLWNFYKMFKVVTTRMTSRR